MALSMPAISLAALPGRRKAIFELAQEAERRGFAGIYMPSLGDNMSLATALALVTERIPFGTAIAPIYWRSTIEFAQAAAFIHEVSNGRFRFGIGIAHAPSHARYGISVGKPLSDTRDFVSELRAVERVGELPPIVLATLRKRMIGLASEVAQGLVFANASRSHTRDSLSVLSDAQRQGDDFFIGNMIPTCVDDDVEAAAAVNRRTLIGYAKLPNYRNYWREAGYEAEMDAVEAAMAAGDDTAVAAALSDRWLADNTLYGPATKVLEGLEAWYDVGVKTPILVPSSARGNQLVAIKEIFDLCERIG